jgi:amino acid adenylation domain-containing protein
MTVSARISCDTPACLHHLIEDQVQRSPHATAISLGGSHLAYADLDARANGVALALTANGVGPGSRVGLAADRSIDAVAGMIGILKAGAAYVPFAAELPEERVRYILATAEVSAVVGSASALAEAAVGDLQQVRAREAAQALEGPDVAVAATDPAYVIFTSGSTGRPKGVLVEHAQIVNSTLARLDVFPLPCTAYVMLAPFTFDASAAGIYLTLATGGRLVVPTDEQVLDPSLLADLIAREAATHLDGVPSQHAVLVAFRPEALAALRCCIVAGEALPSALVRDHYRAAPHVPLFNEYGPTEATVWSAVHRCRPEEQGPIAPIGRPIRNVEIYVVRDERMLRTKPGEMGEIYIGGAGIARGYVGQPALTADRFIPDPFSRRHGARLYRTGDLGALNRDGELLFRGRADAQVKVRGFRVEVGEVEAALLAHEGIATAAVVATQAPTGVRLVAYTVARGCGVAPDELAAFARTRLPEYMVPAAWRSLDALPLTAHGKIDRRRLGSITGEGRSEPEGMHVVVRNDAGQLSVWLADLPLPSGWRRTGMRADRRTCLAHVQHVSPDFSV